MDGAEPMTTGDRIFCISAAAGCSAGVFGYVHTGSPGSAAFATFMALMFWGQLIDGTRR